MVTGSPAAVAPAIQCMPDNLVVPALYPAVVTHSRRSPVSYGFRHRTYYWLTDVDAPPRRGFPVAGFDDPRELLRTSGIRADRILRLAHARSLGHGFNPLTVYWCYRAERLVAAVAEVHNTYGDRHSYLLRPGSDGWAETAKDMYVSPYFGSAGRYRIRLSPPTETISVAVIYEPPGQAPFTATLRGRRRPASAGHVAAAWLRSPLVPLRTSALIRWHGLRLWAKGLPVQPR